MPVFVNHALSISDPDCDGQHNFPLLRLYVTERWRIRPTISPVRNAEGKVVGASKIARDITEQRRSQDKSRRSLAKQNIEARTCLRTYRLSSIFRRPATWMT